MSNYMIFKISKNNSLKKQGFALAEIVIALLLVGMAVSLVAGLGQQVMNLAKSSRQTGAILELRSKSASINRNLDSWLNKMRSSPLTSGIYASCIPDPAAASSIYKCPDVDESLLSSDSELQKIAGTQLHASKALIIDLMGDKLAGPSDDPAFFDSDGRPCDNSSGKCAIKSTGYLLRSNAQTNSNPGSVRFVIKIEQRANTNGTPSRTQYLTMDIGTEWNEPSSLCPSGSIKVGYFSNGKPNCINPTKKCASGKIHLGLDEGGNPICKSPPTGCTNSGIVINAQGDDLACASNTTPCANSQIFLGYYSGTGVPMCSSTNMSCPNGQVQIGIAQEGANLTATCKALPSCQDSQKLSYDGSKFVCQSASVASSCPVGEVVVGINSDGSAKCETQERNLASLNLTCDDGQYVSGLKSDGEVICKDLPPTAPTSGGYTGPLWKCTCGGYMSMVTTSNLIYGETCIFGNGGTANNVQYSSWSCTQIQGNIATAPSSPAAAAWEDVPTSSKEDFDLNCQYRAYTPGTNTVHYFIGINPKKIHVAPSNDSQVYIPSDDKTCFYITPYGRAQAWNLCVSKIEKKCEQNTIVTAPVCTLVANVTGPRTTSLSLSHYANSSGTCALRSYPSQQGGSTPLSASPGQTVTGSSPSSPSPAGVEPYFDCPSGSTKQTCSWEPGSGPYGKFTCKCTK